MLVRSAQSFGRGNSHCIALTSLHRALVCFLQEEQAAALLTGPSDVSGSSSQALPDVEKEQLLARIQQLEAAGQQGSTDWQRGSFTDEEERQRSFMSILLCVHLLVVPYMPSISTHGLSDCVGLPSMSHAYIHKTYFSLQDLLNSEWGATNAGMYTTSILVNKLDFSCFYVQTLMTRNELETEQ